MFDTVNKTKQSDLFCHIKRCSTSTIGNENSSIFFFTWVRSKIIYRVYRKLHSLSPIFIINIRGRLKKLLLQYNVSDYEPMSHSLRYYILVCLGVYVSWDCPNIELCTWRVVQYTSLPKMVYLGYSGFYIQR